MAIAVDIMGGDNAPAAAIDGALEALNLIQSDIILVGKTELIKEHLKGKNYPKERLFIENAETTIEFNESPTVALKTKKDSSIVVGLNLVKSGAASSFVSAGSTGALLAGGTLIVGRIEGIKRPALGTILPNLAGFSLLLDSGANMDSKPEFLVQFAQMGSVYMQEVMGIKNPKIGLINVGSEPEKGDSLSKEAHKLLLETKLNFIGNIEGRELPMGAVDVAICDGFVGNVLLKHSEGFAKAMMGMIKEELTASLIPKIGALLAKPAFKKLKKRFDYTEIGGAPFIGLNGLIVKAHGSSNAKAIKNAIRQCESFEKAEIVSKIRNIID